MPSQREYDKLYIDIALRIAEMSKAKRLKVAALIVYNNAIVSYGYNGTARGKDNCCETTNPDGSLTTKPEVIHSEINSILKLGKNGFKIQDATMYLTHSPCLNCATFIYQSELIGEVVYLEEYRIKDGIEFLKSSGIKVRKYNAD